MSKKIFISYKYGDADVRPLQTGGLIGFSGGTTARDYVDKLETLLDVNDHIYKGENDDESLEGFKDETIASKLQDKIYDSSVTLVLISKNMKDPSKREEDQWIPWEISYSLREKTRDGRTSSPNAILAIVIPDRAGSYEYFVKPLCANGCVNWRNDSTFGIIGKNMFNRKTPKTSNCQNHPASAVHTGDDHSYIHPVKWDDFISNINGYIAVAMRMNENMDDYNIVKIP
jgi:hypothetical protein